LKRRISTINPKELQEISKNIELMYSKASQNEVEIKTQQQILDEANNNN